MCISWTIKCLIIIDAPCKHEDLLRFLELLSRDGRTYAANGRALATFDCERAKKVRDVINKGTGWPRNCFAVTTCASRVGTDRLLRFTRSQATCHRVLSSSLAVFRSELTSFIITACVCACVEDGGSQWRTHEFCSGGGFNKFS